MTKRELRDKTVTVKNSTQSALQTIVDALNKGQRQKLLKKEEIKELLDRYKVVVS